MKQRGRKTAEPTLTWPGRTWEIGAEVPYAAARPMERFLNGVHRLVHGDVLQIVSMLHTEKLSGQVDLVYIDPPFASQADYTSEARLDGRADGRVRKTQAYTDTWSKKDGGVGAYLDMLAPRIEGLVSLLSEKGTIWVHVDWRASYYVRMILDEILGRDAFLNEIVWRRAPNLGRQAQSQQFGRTLDTLIVYGKPKAVLRPPTRLEPIEPSAIRWDEEGRPFTTAPRGDYTDLSISRLEKEGRVHRTPSGKVYIKYFLTKNDEGVLCRERKVDALWTDVAPLRHVAASERTGFPTQKPKALLARIIECATEPGALIVDGFGGSGTTAEAAHATGRRSITCDVGPVAIATARARLMRAQAGFTLFRCDGHEARRPSEEIKTKSVTRAGRTTVTLLSPKEPLAWAILSKAAHARNGVPSTLWHSERSLGAKSTAVDLSATIDTSEFDVVAYLDDGTRLSTAPVAKAQKKRSVNVADSQLGFPVLG